MRSRDSGWLIAKDAHELLASRAYWLLLLATGLLVGHAFITGAEVYGEMSGASGGPAALAQGLSPLDGIVVPTFGALWLAATLLLPFVAIRVVAHEKQTGAWTLLVQGPAAMRALLMSKLLVLGAAWAIACSPAAIAMLLWRAAGNHLGMAEVGAVVLGHALFAWLTIGVAAGAAAVMESEASAAVATLGLTIGTWAIDFIGADRGSAIGALAKLTPGAVLHSFERGLVRPAAALVMVFVGGAGLCIAAVWLNPGKRPSRRVMLTAVIMIVAAGGSALASRWRTTSDWSEDRRNSFPVGDETAIRQISEPVQIEIHLAPEDPRVEDLRVGVVDKLERLLPDVVVSFRSRTRTGLFEQADSSYGEVWYAVGTRRAMSRSATPEIVLALLYQLAGVKPPDVTGPSYPGYPLVRQPGAIALIFFAGWPLLWTLLFMTYRGKSFAAAAQSLTRTPPGK